MRNATIVIGSILTVLALSVGAFALPAMMSPHSGAGTKGAGAAIPTGPAAAPSGAPGGGSTGSQILPPPAANVTENITVTHANTTLWINGTIHVSADNRTVVNLTFEVHVTEGMGANVNFNGTILVNGTEVQVNGTAAFLTATRTVDVRGSFALARDGTTLLERDFAFQLVWSDAVAPRVSATPLPGLAVDIGLTHY